MDQVLAHDVDVVLQHRADRDDRGRVRHGPRHEFADLIVLRHGGVRLHQVDLVLQDDDVFQPHDFHGGQVLGGLGLGAGFVAGDQEEGGVHHRGAVEHRGHQNVVAGTVDEGDVAAEAVGDARRLVCESVGMGGAPGGVEPSLLLRLVVVLPLVAVGLGGEGISLVDLGVGVPELDGDVPLQLVLETDGLNAADGLHDGGLAVGDVADGADIDGRLPRDHLGRKSRQFRRIDRLGVLGHQVGLLLLHGFGSCLFRDAKEGAAVLLGAFAG
mmetsp:Transcript_26170/g.53598  ORF Transcript_26170/g.53598 Transcript_26170/m.53598 type:complete len:270 (+) Transcript_26170:912-1721(+)